MYVKVEDDGVISKRCDDRDAEALMKHAPDVVLHKVPDELGDVGRGIYKYKMVEGAFVLKDDLSDWRRRTNEPSSTRIDHNETNSWLKQTGRKLRTAL